MFCDKCGACAPDNSRFCPECGSVLSPGGEGPAPAAEGGVRLRVAQPTRSAPGYGENRETTDGGSAGFRVRAEETRDVRSRTPDPSGVPGPVRETSGDASRPGAEETQPPRSSVRMEEPTLRFDASRPAPSVPPVPPAPDPSGEPEDDPDGGMKIYRPEKPVRARVWTAPANGTPGPQASPGTGAETRSASSARRPAPQPGQGQDIQPAPAPSVQPAQGQPAPQRQTAQPVPKPVPAGPGSPARSGQRQSPSAEASRDGGAAERKRMLLMAGIAAGTVLLLVLILLLVSKCGGTAVIREESSGISVSQESGSAPVSGPLPAGPTVPNVEGMDAEAAEQTLRDKGYEVSLREAYDESVPQGSVAAQDPAPDSPLDAGGEVRLTVSLGPDLSDTVADWQEPVIETAVRICLGNGTGDILVSDLDAVTTLVLDGGTCRVNTGDTGRSEDETGGPLRLDDLKYFRNLRSLYLYGQDLSSLEPVRSMTGLETLTVCGGSVSDLSPLAGLRSLTALTLTGCGVRSAAPLEGLEQLVLLDLSENPLGSAETVSGLTGLKILRLNGCGIADLMPLVSLTGLSELQLADNEVTDPAALTGMKELTALSLAGNSLGSPGRLQELTSLTTLDLSRTGMTSLAGLEKLTALEALGLSDNELTSIAELASMTRLKTLFIDRVPVRDFSPLYGCRELTYISALKAQNSVGSLVDPYRELRSRLPNCEIVTK